MSQPIKGRLDPLQNCPYYLGIPPKGSPSPSRYIEISDPRRREGPCLETVAPSDWHAWYDLSIEVDIPKSILIWYARVLTTSGCDDEADSVFDEVEEEEGRSPATVVPSATTGAWSLQIIHFFAGDTIYDEGYKRTTSKLKHTDISFAVFCAAIDLTSIGMLGRDARTQVVATPGVAAFPYNPILTAMCRALEATAPVLGSDNQTVLVFHYSYIIQEMTRAIAVIVGELANANEFTATQLVYQV